MLLNITEDHLDRYPSFAAYADAKGNAFVQQTPDDFAIVPEGDAIAASKPSAARPVLVLRQLRGLRRVRAAA